MRKFQEILESDKFDSLREKFRDLFLNLWKEKLEINDVISVGYFDNPNEWILSCYIAPITNNSYKYYKQIFDILEKLDLEFGLTSSPSAKLLLKVSLKTKYNEFIDEMELLYNSNKFNI